MAIHLTEENFEQEVLQSEQTVLVDFWASWCPPCRALNPIIEQVADEVAGQAKVAKLNIDESEAIAAKYQVSSIPTVLVFRNGQVVESIVGLKDKQTYVDALTAVATS